MSCVNNEPDAPFRGGNSGKYKLLVKAVTRKFGYYEYGLVDKEGKKYVASSEEHFAEDSLLRCMVSFDVVNARLSVTGTTICKNQDLAIILPAEKKPKIKLPSELSLESQITVPFYVLGDPIRRRKQGMYKLCVIEAVEREKGNLYILVDSANRKYRSRSREMYPIGSIVPCKMLIRVTEKGVQAYISNMGSDPKQGGKKHKSGRGFSPSYGNREMPTPAAGDHFHLIYTPMGNKR